MWLLLSLSFAHVHHQDATRKHQSVLVLEQAVSAHGRKTLQWSYKSEFTYLDDDTRDIPCLLPARSETDMTGADTVATCSKYMVQQ